jgi:SAM-dependent methyltransferase
MAASNVVTDDIDALRRMSGLATPMTLRVAVTLGLPDRLRDGAGVEELAAELSVDPLALGLLLEHLVTLGVIEAVDTGFRTTALGAHLGVDADNGLANYLDLNSAGGRCELAFVELLHTVTTGRPGYVRRHGRDFWADATEQPNLRASFDRQMIDRIRRQIPGIVERFDWSRFHTLVDVGGGSGHVLAAILTAHHRLRGHLVELDATAATARRTFAERGLHDRADVTTGSFFDPLPAGADAYLLMDILHNWDDEHAHRILARCAEAVRPAGRVLVIEPVGGIRAQSEWNLAMLVMYGGRERRLPEFRALAQPHGLVLDGVIGLTDERTLLEFRVEG